jgi:erythromycin esterase-like protein
MWANRETVALAEWMRAFNLAHPDRPAVGFYGLDVYSLWDSMHEVVHYLERVDPAAAREARKAYACFEPFHGNEQAYARATALVPMSCADEAVRTLRTMRERAPCYDGDGDDAFFDAEQNALVAANAERYYRAMVQGSAESWNVRDRHMMETLDRLVVHHGAGAKAVVWEHNTHIGDARYTDMRRAGMVNVGQLAREAHGEGPRERDGVVLVGFGTREGHVIAGDVWGARMRAWRVPEGRADTWEGMLHEAGGGRDLLLVFPGGDATPEALDTWLDHRAIGVVYDPTFERYGNWVPTVVPRRYDAFLYVERTHALEALHFHDADARVEEPETYPSGM